MYTNASHNQDIVLKLLNEKVIELRSEYEALISTQAS